MKRVVFLLSFILFVLYFTSQAQELPNIVPLSPNAGSIAKYGEIPVGHFTGIPSIDMPLYTIESSELKLPLSLTYHAGGNKVEAIASWVGLGWSLNSLPSISRSVRGIPDEDGYFTAGISVQEIWNEGGSVLNQFKADLFSGTVDSEPDIFFYSILGESGKFFYNQETEEFVTFPKSNIKIIRQGYNFNIVSSEGIEYVFNEIETTTSQSSTVSNPVRTSWNVSEIISANRKDTISFDYDFEQQRYNTKTATTKYQFIGGSSSGVGIENPYESILTLNIIDAQVLNRINFKNGYVEFNRGAVERQDLNGGHYLESITVFNNHDTLLSKHELSYKYIQGSGCYEDDNYSTKWMLLEKLSNLSTNEQLSLDHNFYYNEYYIPPCRSSAAQDYWGYYNGKNSNVDLIPPINIPNTDPPVQILGASRQIDPIKSKFAILKKIVYPTRGYTEFEFENNIAKNNGEIQSQYVSDMVAIETSEFLWDTDNPPDPYPNYFEQSFTINNPPDTYLNALNPNGGAFVNFQLIEPGCDLSDGSNICARFLVIGTDANNSYVYYDIWDSPTSFYLPNGEYKLTAEFNQEPPNYQNCVFWADWEKIDSILPDENKYVGGLRIKEIRNYPSLIASTPIVKKYSYTEDYFSTISSGDVFGNPAFCFQEAIRYDSWEYVNHMSLWIINYKYYYRLRSYTNTQQVSQSGSFVGYKNVIEENIDVDESGYTNYKFSHIRDIPYGLFPYPPDQSMELYRGQLLEETKYKKEGEDFVLIQKRDIEYSSQAFNPDGSYSFGLKWGNNILTNEPTQNILLYLYPQEILEYSVEGGWANKSKETVVNYFGNDSTQQVTNYFYDNTSHLQLTRTESVNSNSEIIKNITYYPEDIASLVGLSSDENTALNALIEQNRVSEVIQSESYNNGALLSTQRTNYHVWGSDIILPNTIQTAKGSNALEDRIIYHSYYDNGKVQEVSKADGTHIVYVWGYNETYPIAKIENATYSEVLSSVLNLQDKSNLDNDSTIGLIGNEGALRIALNNLRNLSALSDALVTTYTYDPLIGVTSITNPMGQTIYYRYDTFNRLEYILDNDGKVLSKNEYNYKNQ